MLLTILILPILANKDLPCPKTSGLRECGQWCIAQFGKGVSGARQGRSCGQDKNNPTCTCYGDDDNELGSCKITCEPIVRSKSERVEETDENFKGKVDDTTEDRYMLYDVKVGEGFNLQKEVFQRAGHILHLANKATKTRCGEKNTGECAPWTLVLPPWCWLAHWRESPNSMLPWRRFMTYSAFKNLNFDVIEFEDYVKIMGDKRGTVDLAVVLLEEESYKEEFAETTGGPKTGGFRGWTDKMEYCNDRENRRPSTDVQKIKGTTMKQVQYSGYCKNGVAVEEDFARCGLVGESGGKHVSEVLENVVARRSRSVLLKHLDSVHIPFNTEIDGLNLEQACFYSDELRKHGDEFIKKQFNNEPFLSCHLRRTDFLYARKETTPVDFKEPVQTMKELMKIRNLKHVFCATDASKEEKDELLELLPEIKFFTQKLPHTNDNAIVESWIAIRGDTFIATQHSRFSNSIQLERSFYGHASEQSEIEFCGAKRSKSDKGKKFCTAPGYRHSKLKGIRPGYSIKTLEVGPEAYEGTAKQAAKDEL